MPSREGSHHLHLSAQSPDPLFESVHSSAKAAPEPSLRISRHTAASSLVPAPGVVSAPLPDTFWNILL